MTKYFLELKSWCSDAMWDVTFEFYLVICWFDLRWR